jgi:hypothetical protein
MAPTARNVAFKVPKTMTLSQSVVKKKAPAKKKAVPRTTANKSNATQLELPQSFRATKKPTSNGRIATQKSAPPPNSVPAEKVSSLSLLSG